MIDKVHISIGSQEGAGIVFKLGSPVISAKEREAPVNVVCPEGLHGQEDNPYIIWLYASSSHHVLHNAGKIMRGADSWNSYY